MCAWAILQSRIKNVYFGSYDLNYGAFSSGCDLCKFSQYKPNVYGGIKEDTCNLMLENYFSNLRIKNE